MILNFEKFKFSNFYFKTRICNEIRTNFLIIIYSTLNSAIMIAITTLLPYGTTADTSKTLALVSSYKHASPFLAPSRYPNVYAFLANDSSYRAENIKKNIQNIKKPIFQVKIFSNLACFWLLLASSWAWVNGCD